MNNSTLKQSGSLKISNDVIIKIAELAAVEVDGVCVVEKRLPVPKTGIFGIATKLSSPIKVSYTKEAATIDISIMIKQGFKALSVASEVQKNVKDAVQNMSHIPVAKVNVKVIGTEIPTEKKEA